ncbi:MAG: acyl-CoA thioesterase [Acidobacteriota bacterium]|nr:acyl-CoA thioesterase [Acidobacteriota bacterium]
MSTINTDIFTGVWRDGWFVVPYHVLFRDIDAFGHVNNAVFFTYFEWGRTQLWFELTSEGRGALDIGFIVAHAECDFRKQIRMEPIEIWTRVGDMRSSSLDFICEIRKSGGHEIAASGKVVVVLYDWARRSKVTISDDLRRKVNEHAAGTRFDTSRSGAAALSGDRRPS